ncbi:hypothetical protein WN55_08098 [Dufourea novaeangliae]|uniref:Uncharacterized protein n=1 Tax=Dufourea novaeangliae TaxID=178035 RepID=A0A154P756_DUFNO|nr:hypothetical protein WN55_08098 [Dufourea novaeangliae]
MARPYLRALRLFLCVTVVRLKRRLDETEKKNKKKKTKKKETVLRKTRWDELSEQGQ